MTEQNKHLDADLQKELEIAKRVQQGLLDINLTDLTSLTVAKRCVPANNIGGDFYTFIIKESDSFMQKPSRVGVIEFVDRSHQYVGIGIGDVAGHGVSSALVMALSSGLLTQIGSQIKSPGDVLTRTNQSLSKYIENSQVRYITLFYGVFNTETKLFRYARGGHPPIFIQKASGDCIELLSEGLFLGMFSDETYEEKSIQLATGDRIIFYTDGILESKNPSGEEYGEERFKACCTALRSKNAQDTLDGIFENVAIFSNGVAQSDDQTVVIADVH